MTTECEVLLAVCVRLLREVIDDGGSSGKVNSRAPWWQRAEHEEKLFTHLAEWKRGVVRDGDSHAHPLVHVAARALMLAYQATRGRVDPASGS